MCDQLMRVDDCLKEIAVMTTSALLQAARALESQGRRSEALLIAQISEISRRKAHVDVGYPDLFSYVTRELGVSEGAAACRIQVARVCQRFPQILQALAAGSINLTVASRISPALTAANCDFLLGKCRGMSSRDVLSLLTDMGLHREPASNKPSLRKASSSSEKMAVSGDALGADISKPKEMARTADVPEVHGASPGINRAQVDGKDRALSEKPLLLFQENIASFLPGRDGQGSASSATGRDGQCSAPLAADRYNLKLSISGELKNKIDRLAEVIGLAHAVAHMEQIIDRAVSDSLAIRDPICKEQRRRRRENKAREKCGMNQTPAPQDAAMTTSDMAIAGVGKSVELEQSIGSGSESIGSVSEASGKDRARKAYTRTDASSPLGYVTAKVRAVALLKAGYRCEFVSKEGQRCQARAALQIDHIVPKAMGGAGDAANVQVLCRGHNIRKGELDLGGAYVHGIIERKRSAAIRVE